MSRSTPTKKKTSSSPASAFTSVAAQLLLRRGGREAANGDSLEFFSDLRKCQPEPRVSGQAERGGPAGRAEDGRGITTRRRGSSAGSDELLFSEIGKHDYDWLLTPPASPRRSPATSHKVSTAAANQLAGAGSAPNAKSNSRLGRTRAGPEKENATSRLARSSSATIQPSSVNTPAFGGRLPRVRTLSSITTAGSNNVSVFSSTSSPRTPGTARSTARPCRQPWSLSSSKSSSRHLPAPTCSRGRAHATTSSPASSPRSTTSTCPQQVPPPTPSKRADIAARSRLAGQSSSGTGSTATTSSQTRRDVRLTRAARASSSSCDAVKTQAAVGKKTGEAAASKTTTQERWRHSLVDKAPAQRTSTLGSSSGLARTVSRPKSANRNKPTTKEPAASQQWSSRSVMSTTSGRIGLLTRTTSEASAAGSVISSRGRRSTPDVAAARAAARVVSSGPDAFPSTRYDAMLLREDPRNLTWLRGCDEDDQGGLELEDGGSLEEPFDVATGR